MKKLLLSICCGIMCIALTLCSINIQSVAANENSFCLKGKSAILIDYNSGDVLFEQNADEKVQVASIVKLMTALLTIEEIENNRLSLNEKLTTTENASGMGGSQVFIDPYVEYSVDEMLKSVIVASANDASVALAERISGSEESFVEKMNKRANELGLSNTLYSNASGLPDPNQHSTARDVAKLTKEVLTHELYFSYSTIWMDKLIHPSGRETEIVNTNKLIRYFKGCDCGKTGSTDEAGFCLTASAIRGNMRLIGVVLGAQSTTDRFNETSKLLNYGFSNYENKQIVSTESIISNIEILRSTRKSIPVFAEENYFAVTKKGSENNFELEIELENKIKAPLKNQSVVGKIKVVKNGVVVKEINLIIKDDIDAITIGESFKQIISKW